MDNSRKSIILSRKEFNTQSSITPTKKHNNNVLSHHSNQKSISYQNDGNGVAGGVSYAELQIILENIHQVKKKAGETISGLEKKNAKMDEQLRTLREQKKRYENLEETINKQKISIELKYQLQVAVLREQVGQAESKNKQYCEIISQLKKQVRNKQHQIQQLNQLVQNYEHKLDEVDGRYAKLTSTLKVTENSHQLILITQQYTDLPTLLQAVAAFKTNLKHQSQAIEELNKNLEEFKSQVMHSNKIIHTITEQNRHLLSLIQNLNREKQSLITELASSQASKSQVLKDKDHTLSEIGDEIETIKKNYEMAIKQKQQIIESLQEEIASLENKLIEAADRERISKQEHEFKMMVDEVCDEYADYENIMKRIQYLEKYRAQYYFNIEKIQYLCKILDQ